jgi:hypothetical protein
VSEGCPALKVKRIATRIRARMSAVDFVSAALVLLNSSMLKGSHCRSSLPRFTPNKKSEIQDSGYPRRGIYFMRIRCVAVAANKWAVNRNALPDLHALIRWHVEFVAGLNMKCRIPSVEVRQLAINPKDVWTVDVAQHLIAKRIVPGLGAPRLGER